MQMQIRKKKKKKKRSIHIYISAGVEYSRAQYRKMQGGNVLFLGVCKFRVSVRVGDVM
jgi:hypothetical protein